MQEGLLGAPFLRLTRAGRVEGDAAADAAMGTPGGGGRQGVDGDSADGDVERDPSAWGHEADRAAVHAARAALEPGNVVHGLALGRTGNGAAGKEGGEQLAQAQVAAAAGGDGGRHLPDGGQGVQFEQIGHAHAAHFGHARQVVAQQVHDHQVLGPLLGAAAQVFGGGRIGDSVRPAWGGAFHGPGGDVLAVPVKEQLGRDAEHGTGHAAGGAGVEHQGIALRLAATQSHEPGPQGGGLAFKGAVQLTGQIDLINLAGLDERADLRDLLFDGALIEVGLPGASLP